MRPYRVRRGGKIERGTAPIGAATGHHQPVGTGDDIAPAQRRIVFDFHFGKPDRVLAVAGAAGDEFVTIAKGVGQFGIGFAGFGDGAVDIAAIDHLGLAGGAKMVARSGTALIAGA